MQKLLIILSPPRSFSSVVSTTIGEHPELYTFPELNLFIGDTVEEVIDIQCRQNTKDNKFGKLRHLTGPTGVLRTLAQLHDGIQTMGSIIRASVWLNERKDWSTKKLLDYLLEKIDPKIGVEKSPIHSTNRVYLERAYAFYPQAYFLHLTRHPLSSRKSMVAYSEYLPTLKEIGRENSSGLDPLVFWYQMHSNIMNFTQSLPKGQSMRIKGEDLLSEPDLYLPQIAEWLGLRTDRAAIEAMFHPENSPYAFIGPALARGGNDAKFLRSPSFRSRKFTNLSLSDFLDKGNFQLFSSDLRNIFKKSGLSLTSDRQACQEIVNLTKILGYQ